MEYKLHKEGENANSGGNNRRMKVQEKQKEMGSRAPREEWSTLFSETRAWKGEVSRNITQSDELFSIPFVVGIAANDLILPCQLAL